MQYTSSELNYSIGDEIRGVILKLIRNLHIIALVTVVAVVLTILYIWFATVLYSSRVDILLDPRQRQTVESEVTPTGLGTSAAGADTLLLESQVEILRSHSILDRLIRSESLTADREFGGIESRGLIFGVKELIKLVVYGPQAGLKRRMSSYDQTVSKLRKRLTIERERNTYVISITMQSSDSAKAARLANRLAEIYIADVNKAAGDSTREAADVLSAKLKEMRTDVNKAAAAVEVYRQENDLIDTNKSLLVEQQLTDLNRELTQARLELQNAGARRNQLRAAISDNTDPLLRVPEIAESPVVSRLQTRLAQAESLFAERTSVYGDRHPVLARSRDRIRALKNSINQELRRILVRVDLAYNTTLEKTEALKAELDKLERQMGVSNTDSIQLRELEREAESINAVYEGFLRRSKEAREQIDIPHSTARVISWAYPASKPSDPPVVLLLAGGLGLGLGLGIVIVLLFGRVSRPLDFDTQRYA